MAKKYKQYPSPEELDTKQEQLEKFEAAKTAMEGVGIEVAPELLQKIEEVSSQTREKLPKWITEPRWIEKLEDLKESLTKAIGNLEGVKGTKRQLASLNRQLEKVENALNQPKEYLHGMSRKEYALKISGEPETKRGNKELTPEEMEEILSKLETRFDTNTQLHEGINWSDVKASLEADPEAIWSLAQMESAGHEPDVYHDDKDNFYFGTCSKEAPKSARNCVYDKEAADKLRKENPNAKFNGSAVEMADAIGISLITPGHYKDILQKKDIFDETTWNWLLTQSDIRSSGGALNGNRYEGNVYVYQNRAYIRNGYRAWRGSLRVKKISA
ncbi:DUF4256 family protein [Candidatus Peregrinibacteria bacterium]|nr:DUF4256 family protein [Candidatus Peregrinibacteria bacterium]